MKKDSFPFHFVKTWNTIGFLVGVGSIFGLVLGYIIFT